MEQLVSQELDAEHRAILSQIRLINKGSIGLAWVLNNIRKNNVYVRWGFRSFRQWVNAELSSKVSQSYAYQLSTIGKWFSTYVEEIESLCDANRTGVVELYQLAHHCENGMDTDSAMQFLRKNTPLPEKFQDVAEDAESPRYVKTIVKEGDFDNFQKVLVLHAILNGHRTMDDSMNGFVLSELQNLEAAFESDFHKRFHPYRNLILNNKFWCIHCGEIPQEPTIHHILPQSLGQGFGPVVLICWPCHQVIQPLWEKYAKLWTGEEVIDLQRKARECINGNYVPLSTQVWLENEWINITTGHFRATGKAR